MPAHDQTLVNCTTYFYLTAAVVTSSRSQQIIVKDMAQVATAILTLQDKHQEIAR